MILAILQARMSSSRLPGKVLKKVRNKALLEIQVSRLSQSKYIDKLVLATSLDASDNLIFDMCEKNKIECFRGDLNNVLDRYYKCAKQYNPSHVVRVTGDCPIIDYQIVDKVIKSHLDSGSDYTSNTINPTFPDGLDIEIMKYNVLCDIWKKSTLFSEKEHVTQYIYNNKSCFKLNSYTNKIDYSDLRWTVDNPEDFTVVGYIIEQLYFENPDFSWEEVLELYDNPKHKNILSENIKLERNSGMQSSILKDVEYREKVSN